jgi:hypothetical protein
MRLIRFSPDSRLHQAMKTLLSSSSLVITYSSIMNDEEDEDPDKRMVSSILKFFFIANDIDVKCLNLCKRVQKAKRETNAKEAKGKC